MIKNRQWRLLVSVSLSFRYLLKSSKYILHLKSFSASSSTSSVEGESEEFLGVSSKRELIVFDVAEKFKAAHTSVASMASLNVFPFPVEDSSFKVNTAPKPMAVPLKEVTSSSSLIFVLLDLLLRGLWRRLLELEEVSSFTAGGFGVLMEK